MTRDRLSGILLAAAVAALAAGRTAWAGVRGLMPLDQSIGFLAAWRLLEGEIPGRDFQAPSGLVPAAVQALVFRLGGVSWSSYVAHAAAADALWALGLFLAGRRLGLGRLPAALVAAAGGLLLFPPVGTPYHDQYAIALAAAALALAFGARREGRAAGILAALSAIVFVLALGSKLLPSGPAMVAAAAFLVTGPRAGRRARLAGFLGALAVAAGGLTAAALHLDVDLDSMREAMIDGPRRVGAPRLEALGRARAPLVAPGLEILTGATWALAVASPLLARDRAAGARPLAALAATFLVLGHLTTALTGNQPETLGGLLAPALLAALAALGRTGRPRLARVLTTLVLAGLVVSLVRFDREVIRTRRGIDIRWTEADEARPPLTAPEALSGLRWKTPELYRWDAAGLETLRAELAAAEGTFWYLGDLGLIHALAGRRPPTPMLWYHPGFTLPDADDPSREAWEDGLVEALRDAGVRRLVIEGEATWMGESWRRFPRVAERLGPGASPARVIGGFVVIEIAAR